MVRIRVIWLSVKYQNFFSLQNVTNAYPPHAVNICDRQNQWISFENKRSLKQSSRLKKNIHNSDVSFDIVTFARYGKNKGNMVVGEIPEFFQFTKRDKCISTACCKCTIYIFTYKSIKVVIRTEFINMTVLLSMQTFILKFFFIWSWI